MKEFSYIFNFGHPGNETGILATLHVNKYLDLYAGINRGANASIQDNNHSAAFEGGFGLHLLDGNLTVLGLTLDGPEDPHNNHDWRYLNDITTIWKVSRSFPFDPSNLSGGKTTYLELTWGLTIKPPMPKPFTGLLIRPEVRYDRALTDQFKPFSQNTSDDQVTLGLDVVMEF